MGHFGIETDGNCTGFHVEGGDEPDKLCVFEMSPPGSGTNHHFTTENWAAFVPMDRCAEAIPWIMQNRQEYDVLVHPNSGCDGMDHMKWSLWGGNKWELRIPSMSASKVV